MNDTPQQTTAMTVAEDNPPPLALVKAPLAAGATPRAIVPVDFDGAYRIANVVVRAGMAPKSLQTVEKAMVAILHGLEVGLTPMNALQAIAVINGRPTIWGDGAVGLIRASGLLEYMEESYENEDKDNMKAVCVVKRRGEPKPVKSDFSMADARKAGLLSKEGPWQTYPKRMLKMRARWPLRDVFADVLKGLSLREEVEDMVEAPHTVEAPARRQVPAPPPLNGEKQATPAQTDGGEINARAAHVEKPSDGFPGDKALPTKPADDDLEIPAALRRTAPKPATDDISDKDRDWLVSLEAAFKECGDVETLSEEQRSLMLPHKDSVTPTVWNKAVDILNARIEQING